MIFAQVPPPSAWLAPARASAPSSAPSSSDTPGRSPDSSQDLLISTPFPRNPGLKQQLFSYAILGFALSEAMGLFCLMMAFLLLFAF